ncbi:hypothetical protein BGI32_10725 [Snodgrassella alvi]|uniref:Lipoprotein n=1 Tax=Snodgrassella alvi TaxID=1196083 RepID=A0A2N9WRL9_9NEIS|nr:hypothetical protein [Snodgrassella alvi]PIT12798.1 hypothetical protein BGI32_10725 [Snodgrassella alvi]
MSKKWIGLALLAALQLTGCASRFEPFAGISTGKNRMYAAPVEAIEYNYENLSGGSIGGGCIPRTPGIDDYDVGKKRYGGGGYLWCSSFAGKMDTGYDHAYFLETFTLSGLASQRIKFTEYESRS